MPDYHRPSNLDQALTLVSQNTRVVAGATDVYPGVMSERAWGSYPQHDWLDITGLAQLRGIERVDDHWRLGALATWSDVVAAPLPASFAGLQMAALAVGGLQIQNRATLVGNLCNASPAADGVPPLLCLDASVELRSEQGIRTLPLSEFILGNRKTALRHDELVTALLIPHDPLYDQGSSGHFYKLGARKYLVISVVMAAAVLHCREDGSITDAKIAVGACSAVARRLSALEKNLSGLTLADVSKETLKPEYFADLQPIDDVRASAEYRQLAAAQAVLRLFEQAGQRR